MENPKFGKKVAELRKAHQLSQYQLGRMVGLTYQAVSKWETKGTVPTRTVCDKLSTILGFDFTPILDDNLTPDEAEQLVEAQKEKLWQKAEAKLRELYGEETPLPILNRFILERNMLRRGKSIILFDIISRVRDTARQKGARFDANEGSCFTGWLLGATDVNPLEPHLRCPKCKKVVFHPEVQSGWDLQDQMCECGAQMEPDGQNIPVETCLLGEGDLFENYRCPVDTDFLNEAERIILAYGEQYFAMERYREEEEEGFVTEPESGLPVTDPETGKKIPYHTLPLSALIFRPKKKTKNRKPERISGPAELHDWGRRAGVPTIVLMGGFIEPSYLSKPSPFRSSPDKLVKPEILDRALADYRDYLSPVMEERSGQKFPDIRLYAGKLTFSKFITLICSVNTLYLTSGPEELAEKTGHTDLTEIPLSMEDLWNTICGSSAWPGYMRGAAGEILLKIRAGQYLDGREDLPGIKPRDRKLFREMKLPDWFETYAANVFSLCYRAPYIDLGIRLLEDARQKIRERR